MSDDLNKSKSINIPADPRFNDPDWEYIPPVATGPNSFLPSGFVHKPKGEIVDGKITLTFGVGDEWVTKKQVQEMIAESENRIFEMLKKQYEG